MIMIITNDAYRMWIKIIINSQWANNTTTTKRRGEEEVLK